MRKGRESRVKGRANFWNPAVLISTFFGVGKISIAPGTWGSLAGVILFFYTGLFALFLVPILFIAGVIAANAYCKATKTEDASEVVIDEVVGQLITIFIALFCAYYFKLNPFLSERCELCFVLAYAICFVTFRFFDILKPWPICWFDKNIKGGLGIMLDDVIAGIFAGLTAALAFAVL